MAIPELETTARAIVADGKGILAADETPGTLTKRLTARGIESTADSRRAYREMFFTTPGVAEFISGVILQDETIRQRSSNGVAAGRPARRAGDHPGHQGRRRRRSRSPARRARSSRKASTGFRDRLEEYRGLGARFAKWRAVITIERGRCRPRRACSANAHALARYAALCQEQGTGAHRRARGADGRHRTRSNDVRR